MLKELYDTSALIYYWKNKTLDISGYTTIFSVIEFPKAIKFKQLVVIYPSREDYDEAIRISIDLLKKGKPIGAIDVLIASIALNRDLLLITMDKHLKYVKIVRPKLKLKFI